MMKYRIVVLFLLSSLCLFAQPKNAEIIEKEGRKYYVHTVEQGNSLWGIHMLYNVSVDDIVASNKGIENGLKQGQKVYIPVPERSKDKKDVLQIEQNQEPTYPTKVHLVQAKETLYGISKKYDLSVDELIAANPGIEKGIKPGLELKIPLKEEQNANETTESTEQKQTPAVTQTVPADTTAVQAKKIKITFSDTIVDHIVLDHETMYSISKRYMVHVDTLQAVNGLRNNRIHPGDTIRIPVRKEKVANLEAREIKQIETKKVDTSLLFKKKDEYAVAILLPFFLEKGSGYSENISDLAAEFYMGAQLAIDSLKKLGLNAKVFVYDSRNDSLTIKNILKKKEFAQMDMVIGPLHSDKMGMVAAWCKANDVKFVSPVASDAQILKENPFTYAAIPSDLTLMEGAASYLLKNGDVHGQVVLIKPTGAKDIAQYDRFRSAYLTLPFKGTRPKLIETSLTDFKTFISKSKGTCFVFPTTDEGQAKTFMYRLMDANKNTNGSISVFGTKEWLNFEDPKAAYRNKYNFHFSAPNNLDYNDAKTHELTSEYRKIYGSDLTKMAVEGFDVLLFFCSKYLLQKEMNGQIMSDFKMVQKGAGNGFENNNCYILKQQDYEIIKVAETNE